MTLLTGESKVKNLVIHVDTGNTIGTKGQPLIYGHTDTFTPLSATVTFENSHDCKAKGIEIIFKAAVKTQYFGNNRTAPSRLENQGRCKSPSSINDILFVNSE